MAGPPVFNGISFQPSDSTEGVCVCVCVHDASVFFVFPWLQVCTDVNIMHICVLTYTCTNLNGVCLQLPRVHRGEVVPDTTGAESRPQPGGVIHILR